MTEQVPFDPVLDRPELARRRLTAALGRPTVRLGLFSRSNLVERLAPERRIGRYEIAVRPLGRGPVAGVPLPDILLLALHGHADEATILALRTAARQAGADPVLIGWTWDNHHDDYLCLRAVQLLDFVLVAHRVAGDAENKAELTVRQPSVPFLGHLPLCSFQWPEAEIDAYWAASRGAPRSDDLFGGYVRYRSAPRRNQLIETLQGRLTVHALSISNEIGAFPEAYRQQTPAEAFADFAAHKVGLVVPVRRDVPNRLFDALVTGEVPLLVGDCPDLDAMIPPDLQQSLPVIRAPADPDAVLQAHKAALDAFDRDGAAGAERRHRHVRDHHLFSNRMTLLTGHLDRLATGSAIRLDLAGRPSAILEPLLLPRQS
jgi:hypothetical protein